MSEEKQEGEVIDIWSREPHWQGPAQCRNDPAHVWQAVVPNSGNPWLLECPKGCGLTGHFDEPFPPDTEALMPKIWATGIYNELERARAKVERLKDLLRRTRPDEAVCVCHLHMGGCWPCEVRAALAEEKEGK